MQVTVTCFQDAAGIFPDFLRSDPLLSPPTRAGAMIAYLAVLTIATIGGIATFASTDTNALKGLYSSSFYQNRQGHSIDAMPVEVSSPRQHACSR